MNNGRFTKIMWLTLVVCVAVVTFIAKVFGLKALVAFTVVASIVLWVFERVISDKSGNKRKESE